MKISASISANICHLLLNLFKSQAYLYFLEFCSFYEPKSLAGGPKAIACKNLLGLKWVNINKFEESSKHWRIFTKVCLGEATLRGEHPETRST